MRILHVLETLAAGGVETTFLNVLRHLPRDGMTHDVLALSGGALESEFRSVAACVTIEQRRAAIERLLTDQPYDVAYVLFERCAERLLPLFLTRTSTRIVYGKNYDFSGQWRSTEGFVSHADAAMLEACDGVTFTTSALAAAYGPDQAGLKTRLYEQPPQAALKTRLYDPVFSRGLVLGKGADVNAFMALAAARPEVGNRIVAVANPTPRKRLGDLVEALVHVRRLVPDAQVRIVGSGDPDEVARLTALSADLGVGEHVVLIGGTRDVVNEIDHARVLALPSGSEGVPTAVLEAMAAARPVVVTDAGHTRTIVDDGIEGYIVPIGDVPALADRLVRVLTNRTLAAVMGQRGRVRAARHGVEAIAGRLSAYLKAIAEAPCH